VSDTPLDSQKLSLRLPTALVLALQHEAMCREVPPSEWMRTAIARFLAEDGLAARHPELLSEVAKTRSLLVRFFDKKIGEPTTDTLVHTAEGNAQSDVAKRQRREGGPREQVPLPVAAALGSDASNRAVGQYHLVNADTGRSLEMMGAPPSHGSPLAQKACAKGCPFLHSGVTRLAPSIPLPEHTGTALVVQRSLSCRMTSSLCSDHMRGSFLAAS
jgi:hypothetical protein